MQRMSKPHYHHPSLLSPALASLLLFLSCPLTILASPLTSSDAANNVSSPIHLNLSAANAQNPIPERDPVIKCHPELGVPRILSCSTAIRDILAQPDPYRGRFFTEHPVPGRETTIVPRIWLGDPDATLFPEDRCQISIALQIGQLIEESSWWEIAVQAELIIAKCLNNERLNMGGKCRVGRTHGLYVIVSSSFQDGGAVPNVTMADEGPRTGANISIVSDSRLTA